MRLAGILTVLLPLLLVLAAPSPCHVAAARHNITDILAAYPNFTEFSAALTSTGAAAEIDLHSSITVLAVDNAAMAQLKAQHLQPKDLERVTYLNVLLDYLDSGKLRNIQDGTQETSLFQALGKAQASEGMVKITVSGGGRVAFSLSSAAANAPAAAFFQKSIKELPSDIAVLQVSAPIWSPAAPVAAAPQPVPAPAALAPPPAPAPGSSPAPAPAMAHAHASPPAPAPASSPADAPTPALAPAVAPAPAIPPTPRRRPAPAPEVDTPAASPDADTEPPADDQKNNGARDMASWSLGTAVAAVVPVIVLLLW